MILSAKKRIGLWMLISIVATPLFAQHQDEGKSNGSASAILRVHGGPVLKGGSISSFLGGRIMLPASPDKRFGLTFSRFAPKDQSEFYSFGIILEQKLFGWLNSSIGTVGYFNYRIIGNHVAGITTSTGWEPNIQGRFRPYIAYRSDFIFADSFEANQSIYVGINFEL